jgi:hypothetical protein
LIVPTASGVTLFTSDSRRRYATDLLNVLALPPGAHYQFRYETKYVPPELRHAFEASSVAGTRALIAFRDESVSSAKSPFIVPVRWATISEIELISDFYVIRFSLAGYPVFSRSFATDKAAIHEQCKAYLQQVPENARHLPVQAGLTPLVEPRDTDDKSAWINVARALALHVPFSTTHFIRIAKIVSAKTARLSTTVDGEYVLAERQYAEIQLDYFAVNYGPPSDDLQITSDQSLIRVASLGSITLDSRYDSRKLRIQGGSVPGKTTTELQISTRGPDESLPQTRLRLPFMVRPSRKVIAYKVVTSAVGAALIATPAILGPTISPAVRIAVALTGAIVLAIGTNITLKVR